MANPCAEQSVHTALGVDRLTGVWIVVAGPHRTQLYSSSQKEGEAAQNWRAIQIGCYELQQGSFPPLGAFEVRRKNTGGGRLGGMSQESQRVKSE